MKRLIAIFFGVLLLGQSALGQQVIKVVSLKSKPVLDGSTKDWEKVPSNTVSVKGDLAVKSVEIKVGKYQNRVYFLAKWKDSTEDLIHNPFVWNSKKNKYIIGKIKEDRFSMQFKMKGNYTTEWDSGNLFEADMWHWKAGRTNPLGLAHDKMTIISRKASKKAFKLKSKKGYLIYILRPSDKGSKLYKSVRYKKKEQDTMPKYILQKNPKGSVADIKAKGVWRSGEWVLEMSRKMNTGNKDDVVFKNGGRVEGGIAIFDHTGTKYHDISDVLVFQF